MKNVKTYSKKYLVGGIVFLAVAIVTAGYFGNKLEQVRISQDFAQQQVSEKLPITKSFKIAPLISADLIVRDMRVNFHDDAQLGITAHCGLTSNVGEAEIEVSAVGTPEFNSANRAFYFKPSRIEFSKFIFSKNTAENAATAGEIGRGILDTQLNGRGKGADKLKKMAAALGGKTAEKAVDKKLDQAREKVAQLKPEDIAEKIKIESIGLVSDALTVYLNKHPIKKLDGVKGTIISLTVEKVTVENEELVIDFSLLKLTGTLILFATLTVVFAAAMVTAPWWMQVLAILPIP